MQKKSTSFSILRTQEIPEIHSTATLYEHRKTKAQLLSLTNQDENKSFAITFRTPPPDSSGIAHIMEHSVLCGSKNYPLKEPFIELVKGSLHTFLNAFTYPDKTSYPVASTNEQDFYNLTRVYMDAVFFPLISKETLMQEGWHLHQEKKSDPVTLRGVVYNEMKGAYNSPDRALWDTIQSALLPDTPYRHDSGGDPLMIPTLTYEHFKQFHQTYYHPSNALLFFSGNDPEEERLLLADEYLAQFEYQEIHSEIALQPPFSKPTTVRGRLPIGESDDPKKKGMVTLNWLLSKSTDVELALRLRILSLILVGTPASPLRKALVDSGMGEDIAGGGVESELQQMLFSIGLRGMDVTDANRVKKLITGTLQKLAKEGIDSEIVESALRTTEFHLREQNTGSFPRGLSLLYGILPSWLYGGDPITALSFQSDFDRLQDEISSGKKPFEQLIQQYLLKNNHQVLVILDPDKEEQKRRDAQERQNASELYEKLSTQEQMALPDRTHSLMTAQTTSDSPELLATLPKLRVQDLGKESTQIPTDIQKNGTGEILMHPLATNGIIYLDLVFDLCGVPERLLPLVPLFTRCLTEMGTDKEDFASFMHRQNTYTGGIHASMLTNTVQDSKDAVAKMILRAKWLEKQTGPALDLIRSVLLDANLSNQERFKQMVLEEKTEYEQEVLESGHHFADARIRARFRTADWLDEQFGGITQLFFLRELVTKVDTQWSAILKDLQQLRSLLIRQDHLVINITTDPEIIEEARHAIVQRCGSLPALKVEKQTWNTAMNVEDELLVVPTTVNYVGKGINLYDVGFPFTGSSIVIAKYLRSSWLWEQVRMKGGAYGAFSSFHPLSGTFSFLSYRDPHIEQTLAVFDQTAKFLREIKLSDDELTKAIIGAISDVDHYLLPDAKGLTSLSRHLTGVTDARRQQTRTQILSTAEADFHAFAQQMQKLAKDGMVCITTAKTDILPTAKQITL